MLFYWFVLFLLIIFLHLTVFLIPIFWYALLQIIHSYLEEGTSYTETQCFIIIDVSRNYRKETSKQSLKFDFSYFKVNFSNLILVKYRQIIFNKQLFHHITDLLFGFWKKNIFFYICWEKTVVLSVIVEHGGNDKPSRLYYSFLAIFHFFLT